MKKRWPFQSFWVYWSPMPNPLSQMPGCLNPTGHMGHAGRHPKTATTPNKVTPNLMYVSLTGYRDVCMSYLLFGSVMVYVFVCMYMCGGFQCVAYLQHQNSSFTEEFEPLHKVWAQPYILSDKLNWSPFTLEISCLFMSVSLYVSVCVRLNHVDHDDSMLGLTSSLSLRTHMPHDARPLWLWSDGRPYTLWLAGSANILGCQGNDLGSWSFWPTCGTGEFLDGLLNFCVTVPCVSCLVVCIHVFSLRVSMSPSTYVLCHATWYCLYGNFDNRNHSGLWTVIYIYIYIYI